MKYLSAETSERYLFALGAPRETVAAKAAGRQFSDGEWKDICLRHDNYFV